MYYEHIMYYLEQIVCLSFIQLWHGLSSWNKNSETDRLLPLSLWFLQNIFLQIFNNLGIHWVVYQRVPECVRVCKPEESIRKRISCKMFPFCSNRIWVTERCSPNKDCVDVAKCRIGQSKCRTQHQLIKEMNNKWYYF